MEINTKFNMGQAVFSTQCLPNENPSIVCTCCDGTGKVIGKNEKEYYCPDPDCRNGQVVKPCYLYKVVPGVVSRIEVKRENSFERKDDGSINKNKPIIITNECYGIAGDRSSVYIKDLFGTQEEAEIECEKRNEKNKNSDYESNLLSLKCSEYTIGLIECFG